MNAQTDQQLLQDYAGSHSEPAFAELVRRHIDLVYSAALRMVCDSHQAEDVTQGVFVALAQNARQLTHHPVLSGWLHRTTQNLAANAVRANVRRQTREREALAMNELLSAEPDTNWENIAPHLDAALGELSEPDRDAVLLRYFERKSAHEMAQTLGISDEAAQKRVNRAVERLREFFAKRGVTVGASGLIVVISANAVQAAPMGLALTISAAALASATLSTSTAIAVTTKTIAMTTLQKIIATATVAILAGAGIYEAHQAFQLREQIQTLQEQQAPLVEQIQALQRERDEGKNRLAGLLEDISRWESNPNQTELLKLRGEVTRLKAAENRKVNDPAEAAAKSWADRVTRLKQRLEQTPGAKIPEFKYLTDANWLDAASEPLVSDEDYRRAFARLRSVGENQMIISMHKALGEYMKQNGGQFPTDLSQLKSHFETLPDDEMLQRYTIVPASQIPNMKMGGDWLITVKNPVDEEFDSLWAMGPKGFGSSTYKGMSDAKVLDPVLKAFAAANNGQEPKDSSELLPYLTTPEQQVVFKKLEQKKTGAAR
ncbi:MAG: sigma-70 family RNA polymerase sigma factor [Verrucomicrobia bacterium]|nr:sigma-70 family RNA polymerase sigma factor [Verrucomicrobiota bacterium]